MAKPDFFLFLLLHFIRCASFYNHENQENQHAQFQLFFSGTWTNFFSNTLLGIVRA